MTEPYPKHRVTALILAGGMGRRMGNRDKGLLDYQGRPLISHVATALSGQVADLIVSANRSLETYRALGYVTVADLRPDFPGPLAGIEAGLAACNTEYLLVTPCDTPFIPKDLGPRLWQAMQASGADLAYACDAERKHFLHLLLPTRLATDLAAYLDSGERAVRHWLADKQVAQAYVEKAQLRNLNERDDLV